MDLNFKEMDEFLDEAGWKLEANAVINDIKSHVQSIKISETIKNTNKKIYFNLTTLENNDYCIELTGIGFRIVGYHFDEVCFENNEYFETPYSLLNKISPLYNQSFSQSLIEKLDHINKTN